MADKLKILEAFGEPIADGGQEAFVFGVMDKMDMSGITIDCLTAYDCRSDYYKGLVKRLGGKVYALNLPFAPGKSRNNIKKPFQEFLKTHKYDVVHIHSGSISVLAIMASVAGKAGVKKVIVHSHVDGEKDNLKHKILRFIASLSMAPHVDIYCACSQKAADWKFEPKYAKGALIIKNGIDTERFSYRSDRRIEMRKKMGLSDSFVIGHVGRFNYQKNHEFLFGVFEKIVEISTDRADPLDVRLLLVGAGEEMETIKSLVEAGHLEDKVAFIGSVTNVEDYLQAMDVFVLPSRFEGFGIVALEAECAGLPVVASDRVPRDIKLTEDVNFISLEAGKDIWANKILDYRFYRRRSNLKNIPDAGFDLHHTAQIIRGMYIDEQASSKRNRPCL